MKVGILLKGSGGRQDVAPGTIVLVREFPDEATVTWGRKCVPPNFWTVVINRTRIADLPVDYRPGAYGCHCSRKRLDVTRLTDGKDKLLTLQPRVGMSLIEFRLACLDNGDYWQPEVTCAH